jgi:hypothetical protein
MDGLRTNLLVVFMRIIPASEQTHMPSGHCRRRPEANLAKTGDFVAKNSEKRVSEGSIPTIYPKFAWRDATTLTYGMGKRTLAGKSAATSHFGEWYSVVTDQTDGFVNARSQQVLMR